jgi:Leucine-rich repeat (LRR) protein
VHKVFIFVQLKMILAVSDQNKNCQIIIPDLECTCDRLAFQNTNLKCPHSICSSYKNTGTFSKASCRTIPCCVDCDHQSYHCVQLSYQSVQVPNFSLYLDRSEIYSIEIKNKNYTLVPDFLFQDLSVENLHLKNNRIRKIAEKAFENIHRLRDLRLSNNDLVEVNLRNLMDLEILYLDGNLFKSITKLMFMRMKKLKILCMSYNKIDFIEQGALSENLDLLKLDLFSNHFKSFEIGLSLQKLAYLDLNKNFIKHLKNGTFKGLDSLKVIYLQNNDLEFIEPEVFVGLDRLEFLHLGNSYLKLMSRESMNFNLKSLTKLVLSQNIFEKIEYGVFTYLPNLTQLEFFSNRIKEIEPFSFQKLNLLIDLDLSNQMLGNLPDYEIFNGLENLKILKLNNNSLTNLQNRTFIRLVRLELLDLGSNEIGHIEQNAFQGLDDLTELFLTFNLLTSLNEFRFSELSRLSNLSLDKNAMIEIEQNAFQGLDSSLSYLNLNQNRLQFLKKHHFQGLKALRELNLRDNQISSIELETFKDLINLEILDLADNSIAGFDPGLFVTLQSLLKLDLSMNVLANLRPGSFKHLKSLRELYLNDNRLQKVDFSQVFHNESAVKLEKLIIDNNLINEIGMKSLYNMKQLTFLSLSNNNRDIIKILGTDNMQELPLRNLRHLFVRNVPYKFIRRLILLNLKELDLSHNTLDYRVYFRVKFETIETISLANLTILDQTLNGLFLNKFGPKLTSIDLSLNKIEYLYPNQFMNNSIRLGKIKLSGTNLRNLTLALNLNSFFSLKYLDLSSNMISELPDNFFINSIQLLHLNLSRNSIRKIDGQIFLPIQNLIELDLGFNQLEILDEGSFSTLFKLEFLDLSHNRLRILDQSIFGDNYLGELRTILLNNNKILKQIAFFFDYPHSYVINLAGSNLTEIPLVIRNNILQIEELDFSSNCLKSIQISFFKMTNLIFFLSFRNNSIEEVQDSSFGVLRMLITLDLSSNFISNITNRTFSRLHNLEILSLSSNIIEMLDGSIFDELYYLEKLDLRSNKIKFIHGDVFKYTHFLTAILFDGNPIEVFFKNETLKGLVSLKYLELPTSVVFNFETCLIIKNTLQIKRIKEVLGWTYFGSIDFLAVDSIKDFPAYSDNQCFFILYLSRNNLKLNLFNDELVAKFVNDCQDWIGQTYSKMRESIESFS